MKILRLLDDIEEILDGGTSTFFSSKVKVDKAEIHQIVSEIKYMLPKELKEAEKIAEEKARILEEAQEEADELKEDVKRHVERMIDESEILRQAEEKSEMVVEKATLSAKEIREGANLYTADLLNDVTNSIEKAKAELNEIIEEIEENKKEL